MVSELDQEKRLIIGLNQNQDFGKKYYNKVIACMEIEGKWKVIAVADNSRKCIKKSQ